MIKSKEEAASKKKIINYDGGHDGELIQPNLDDNMNPGTAPGNGNVINENCGRKEDEVQSTIYDVRVIRLCYYVDLNVYVYIIFTEK